MIQAAIIIPHYNDLPRLMRCLSALAPQLNDRCELLVVDNNSTDDLASVRRTYPFLEIVIEPRRGAAEARNRGVRETTAPYLFFLDADCIPAANWVETALAVAGEADLIGGRIDLFDETPPPRSGAQAFETVFAFNNCHYVNTLGFSVTANLLTRRDVFEAVGPFVTGVSEDLNWCHRARALDYSITYDESLRVSHPTRSDWNGLRKKWLRLTQETYMLRPKTLKGQLSWVWRSLAMPLSVLAHGPQVLCHPKLTALERQRALVILVRLRLLRATWMLRQVFGVALK